ncbi:roundabout-like protein, partial [Aphelenchoides avenae]
TVVPSLRRIVFTHAPRNMANSCLLFLFLVRMTAGFNDSLVQITEPPSDTTAEIGQEVLLKCRVNHTRHPDGYGYWRHDGYGLFPDTQPRYSLVGEYIEGEYDLHIINVTANDAGMYECRATTSISLTGDAVRSALLTVFDPRDDTAYARAPNSSKIRKRITTGPVNTTTYMGGSVILKCRVEHKGWLVAWSLNDWQVHRELWAMDHLLIIHTAPVPSGSSHAIYDLYIDNVKAKDTGKYNCLVGYENEFVKVIIEQSQDAYLTITEPASCARSATVQTAAPAREDAVASSRAKVIDREL